MNKGVGCAGTLRAYEKQAMMARIKSELKSAEKIETSIPALRARAINLRVIIVETPQMSAAAKLSSVCFQTISRIY